MWLESILSSIDAARSRGSAELSVQRWPGGSAEQGRIDAADDVVASAAPGERQVDQRKPTCPHGETDGDALGVIAGAEAIASLRDLTLFEQEVRADRPPHRVLDALLEGDQVRSSKEVIVVGGQ